MSTAHCPRCGQDVSSAGRFCGACGAPLGVAAAAPAVHEAPTLVTAGRAGGADRRPAPAPPIWVLTVECPGQPRVADLPLGDAPLSIGRAASCDLVIDAPAVSRLHAIVEPREGGFVLRDQHSTNGLYVTGRRVEETVLREGEPVRIPDPYGNLVTLLIRRASAMHAVQAPLEQARTVPLAEHWTALAIGRGAGNDLGIDQPLVSRRHARLERRDGQVLLLDLGSTNGTYLNGERVSAPQPVRPDDEIQIGPARFRFEGSVLRQIVGQPTVRIDAVNLSRRVGRGTPRLILRNVSLSILPREFVALVGGSGAGKSTLLYALSGATPAQSGLVLFNGHDFYRQPGPYTAMIGYVPQDDILHRDLPVERALDYAAQLRLPPDTSDEERARRIAEVLGEVRMEPFRAQVIASLSGGQRKRVSIALELLANPSVIFLDEPTSGLDPGLDKTVMGLLQLLCDKGHTIVLVTHATENIGLCDLVAFMAPGGRLAYYGPPAQAPAYFGVPAFPDIYSFFDQHPDAIEQQETRYKESDFHQTYVIERRREAASMPLPTMPPISTTARQVRAAAWRQWTILTARYAEILRRDRTNLILLLAQAPIVAILLALVASSDSFTSLALGGTQQDLVMLTLAAIWFGTINAAREIVKERPIYLRERMVNLRIWPYILSKFAVLSVLAIAQSLALVIIVLLKTPHAPAMGVALPAALEMYITLVLAALAALAGGLLISSLVSSADRAMSIVPVVLLAQVIFCGGAFDLHGATDWIALFAVSRWSLAALGLTANLNGLAAHITPPVPGWPKAMYSSPDLAHLAADWLVLVLFAALFLAGTYRALRKREAHG